MYITLKPVPGEVRLSTAVSLGGTGRKFGKSQRQLSFKDRKQHRRVFYQGNMYFTTGFYSNQGNAHWHLWVRGMTMLQ